MKQSDLAKNLLAITSRDSQARVRSLAGEIERHYLAKSDVLPALGSLVAICGQLAQRLAVLEKRAAAGGAGVTIVAKEGLEFVTPGLPEVAAAIEKLSGVMSAPVRPIHGADGRLVGAVRDVPK